MQFDAYGKYIFFDGAMGTMLQKHGLKPNEKPDLMNITDPDTVERIHRSYIEAGSNIICTNTFSSNALGLEGTGYSPAEVITAAVQIAKRAASQNMPYRCDPGINSLAVHPPLIALDIGPTGHLLEPYGDMSFEQACELFMEMAVAGEKAGADIAAIETMSDINELKAAMTAVGENTNLIIFATMTFEKSGHTFMGCTPEAFVETAESLGAAAVGLNCSLEPSQMYDIAKRLASATKLPLIVKPNAGLPSSETNEYDTDADEFAKQMLPYAEIGVRVIGGCCGTTPEYIAALRRVFLN